LQKELCQDEQHEFHYTQGDVACELPPNAMTYFGPAPHYRFLQYYGKQQDGSDIFMRLRNFPQMDSPEDTMRTLAADKGDSRETLGSAMSSIDATIQAHGPFDAVIGYSEGAMLASTLLVEDRRRQEEEGLAPRFKFGVFICGWPPISPLTDQMLLADQHGQLINVPTCHVVGASDPFVSGSVALYNLCDTSQLRLFDHGRGHIVPRDKTTVVELASVLREMTVSCA
jgi:predicted esterase